MPVCMGKTGVRAMDTKPIGGEAPTHTARETALQRASRLAHDWRSTRRILVLGAGLLAVIVAVAWWMLRDGNGVSYVTAPVSRGAIARAVTATGSVNPGLTVTVGTYVSGVVQEIYCDFNTVVKKGQLCAKIDPRPFQTIVAQDRALVATARAQLVKDQANLAYAGVNERRFANLVKQRAASQDAHDVALNTLNQARAQVALDKASIQQRTAELDAAVVNLGYTDINSPVDGIVVSRNVTTGQTVAASFQTPTLFLIATDLSKMQVDTNVSESDVGGVRVGHRALFTVEAYPDKTFEGKVIQVRQAPQTVQNVVTYDVVLNVSNPELLLKPGMTATVRIITDERKGALRVPDQALRYVPGGMSSGREAQGQPEPQVWVLEDGMPKRVTVKTGLDDDTHTEILGGTLREGDRVIVSERGGQTSDANARRAGSAPSMRFP